jgi:hypothetical protein
VIQSPTSIKVDLFVMGDDPQLAEVALLAAAADKRVIKRLVDGFFRGAVQLALVGVEPLRALQQFAALATRTVPLLTRGMISSLFLGGGRN